MFPELKQTLESHLPAKRKKLLLVGHHSMHLVVITMAKHKTTELEVVLCIKQMAQCSITVSTVGSNPTSLQADT